MSEPDPIDIIIARAGILGSTLDEVSARILATELGFDAATASQFVNALKQHGEWHGSSPPPGTMGLLIREWRIDLKKPDRRDKVMEIILTATLQTLLGNELEISFSSLILIILSILDIERVSLTDDHKRLLIEVQRMPGITDKFVSIEEIYRDLPEAVQDQVDLSDFKKFIERLRLAGHVVEDTEDDTIRFRDPSERIPRIRWK